MNACPKCGGKNGRKHTETVRRERYESWGGGRQDTGDETVIAQTQWRCFDCNTTKIPQGDLTGETP